MGKASGPRAAALAAAVLGLAALAGCSSASKVLPSLTGQAPWACPDRAEQHVLVTELVLGTSAQNAAYVGDRDWQQFLVDTVTPRFPDSIASRDGFEQHWDKTGNGIVRQNTKVLTITAENNELTQKKLEEVVLAYKSRFRQNAVMRTDQVACAGAL